MKAILAASLLLFVQLSHADDGAVKAARSHMSNSLRGDYERLGKTYASKVALMPGHEFLKEEYGIAGAGARARGVVVDRAKLLAAMLKASADQPKRPEERVERLLKSLKYESLKTAEGDFATDAADPVGTPDGKLHFSIAKGDVLLRISPGRGDFVLLHMRKSDRGWRVVAEYLD